MKDAMVAESQSFTCLKRAAFFQTNQNSLAFPYGFLR
jgi:hypothetical protein